MTNTKIVSLQTWIAVNRYQLYMLSSDGGQVMPMAIYKYFKMDTNEVARRFYFNNDFNN